MVQFLIHWKMKKTIQDLGVLIMINVVMGLIAITVNHFAGWDVRFMAGFITGNIYYVWYKPSYLG